MAWEDAWLLPQVDDQAETPWVTRLIQFDHRQITHEVDQLRTDHALLRQHPSREAIAQVSGDLSGLATLLRADLEREERFLGPLTPQRDRRLGPGLGPLMLRPRHPSIATVMSCCERPMSPARSIGGASWHTRTCRMGPGPAYLLIALRPVPTLATMTPRRSSTGSWMKGGVSVGH